MDTASTVMTATGSYLDVMSQTSQQVGSTQAIDTAKLQTLGESLSGKEPQLGCE